jgi:hypothetical protein
MTQVLINCIRIKEEQFKVISIIPHSANNAGLQLISTETSLNVDFFMHSTSLGMDTNNAALQEQFQQ